MSTNKPYHIGWVVDSAPTRVFSFPWQRLGPVSQIRYGHVARHIHAYNPAFRMERYRPWKRYDGVVIVKKLNEACLDLVSRQQAAGAKVIFDSNVNYYEEWGDFDIPGTRPTPEQKSLAERMTRQADAVVADSSYLFRLCKSLNACCVMIPDAVDTDRYAPRPDAPPAAGKLRLIWSGISKKAHHLKLLEPVLQKLKNDLALHLVINRPHPKDPPSPVIRRLQEILPVKISYYDYDRYVNALREADAIISPKILSSSYEMAHTEYKITTGMAVGIPAIASPQESYLEAIGQEEGGWICRSPEDWQRLLQSLITDRSSLRERGARARSVVLKTYSVPKIAEQYAAFLERVLQGGTAS